MAALTQDRQTNAKDPREIPIAIPVAAATTIYAGAMVAVNAAGYAVPAAKTAGLVVRGRADSQADNSAGSAGDIYVTVEPGIFLWENDGNAVAQADCGRPVYVVDDQTVADETEGSAIIAGVLDSMDDKTGLPWVRTLGAGVGAGIAEGGGIETVTSDAISLYTATTLLSVTGTQAYTLADGLYEGQRKLLKCSVAATTPVGTVTPASMAEGTTLVFHEVGEYAYLEWHAAGWYILDSRLGLTYATVTSGAVDPAVGCTYLSVTGTQAYTLADGTWLGETIHLYCTVAATTPDGTLTPVSFADGTTLGFDAVGEEAVLVWNGTAWKVSRIVGATVA